MNEAANVAFTEAAFERSGTAGLAENRGLKSCGHVGEVAAAPT
jgi:hypothetical protein